MVMRLKFFKRKIDTIAVHKFQYKILLQQLQLQLFNCDSLLELAPLIFRLYAPLLFCSCRCTSTAVSTIAMLQLKLSRMFALFASPVKIPMREDPFFHYQSCSTPPNCHVITTSSLLLRNRISQQQLLLSRSALALALRQTLRPTTLLAPLGLGAFVYALG